MAALRVVLVSYPVAMVLLLGLAVVVGGDISQGAAFWGGLCGVSQAFGVWWFYAALGAGPISVVSPLTAILVAAIPVGVGLALGERPGAIAGVGVVLALAAVVLVSREATDEDVTPHRFTTKVAWLTVGSGVAFGLNFVLIAQAPHRGGAVAAGVRADLGQRAGVPHRGDLPAICGCRPARRCGSRFWRPCWMSAPTSRCCWRCRRRCCRWRVC